MTSSDTFVQLHKIIQCVFSWQDRHPYQFDINGISIVDPHIADVDGVFLASEQRLKDVSLPWQAQMLYTYDFRSKWIHLLNVNGALKEYEGGPKLIAGEGDAPPEDIGSTEEYLDFWILLTIHVIRSTNFISTGWKNKSGGGCMMPHIFSTNWIS